MFVRQSALTAVQRSAATTLSAGYRGTFASGVHIVVCGFRHREVRVHIACNRVYRSEAVMTTVSYGTAESSTIYAAVSTADSDVRRSEMGDEVAEVGEVGDADADDLATENDYDLGVSSHLIAGQATSFRSDSAISSTDFVRVGDPVSTRAYATVQTQCLFGA